MLREGSDDDAGSSTDANDFIRRLKNLLARGKWAAESNFLASSREEVKEDNKCPAGKILGKRHQV